MGLFLMIDANTTNEKTKTTPFTFEIFYSKLMYLATFELKLASFIVQNSIIHNPQRF